MGCGGTAAGVRRSAAGAGSGRVRAVQFLLSAFGLRPSDEQLSTTDLWAGRSNRRKVSRLRSRLRRRRSLSGRRCRRIWCRRRRSASASAGGRRCALFPNAISLGRFLTSFLGAGVADGEQCWADGVGGRSIATGPRACAAGDVQDRLHQVPTRKSTHLSCKLRRSLRVAKSGPFCCLG